MISSVTLCALVESLTGADIWRSSGHAGRTARTAS
jgi:hypothetical protein